MDGDLHSRDRSPVDALRSASLWLVGAAIIAAVFMASALKVPVDPLGLDVLAWIIGTALIVSKVLHSKVPRIADGLGALAQAWIGGLAGCTVAVLGLRMNMPLRDASLLAMDRAIGVDGPAVLVWSLHQPQWFVSLLSMSYGATVELVCISILLLALLGDRVEVWRAAMCFTGAVLTTCLISIVTPAKGMGAWISSDLLARLPTVHTTRHFWPRFEHFAYFYDGASPVLGLNMLGPAVTFPSFHTIMGLIVAAAWRKRLVTFVPACAWLIIMLFSTLPFGGHYLVDLFAGGAVWGMWFALSKRVERSGWAPVSPARLAAIRRGGQAVAIGK